MKFRTPDDGWASIFGAGSGVNNFSVQKQQVTQRLNLDEFLETTYATENEYKIWNFECHESLGMSGSLKTWKK
jgi:hypothetical protein